MPSPRLSREQREKFLAAVCDGSEPDAARAALGLTKGQIAAGGKKPAVDVSAAYAQASAAVVDRILRSGLTDENPALLKWLVERREAAQARMDAAAGVTSADAITRVERAVIDGTCHACGGRSGKPDLSRLTDEQVRSLHDIARVLGGEDPAPAPAPAPRRHPLGALGETHRDASTPPAPAPALPPDVVPLRPPRPSYGASAPYPHHNPSPGNRST